MHLHTNHEFNVPDCANTDTNTHNNTNTKPNTNTTTNTDTACDCKINFDRTVDTNSVVIKATVNMSGIIILTIISNTILNITNNNTYDCYILL